MSAPRPAASRQALPRARRWLVAALAAAGVAAAGPAAGDSYFPIYATWPQPDGPGSPITITYAYSNLLDGGIRDAAGAPLPAEVLTSAFEAALQDYADFLPIHFVEVADQGPLPETGNYDPAGLADIRVGHVPHIDGANAYAYFPTVTSGPAGGLAGDIVYNAGRFGLGWSPLWFYAVAQHELGHSLGMGHAVSTAGEAAGETNQALAYDGPFFPIEGGMKSALVAAYGAGIGSVTPITAVPEPAAAALWSTGLVMFYLVLVRRRHASTLLAAAEWPESVHPRASVASSPDS